MTAEMFNKILAYITCENKLNMYMPDKLLYNKVSGRVVLEKFVSKWLDDPNANPIYIIDDMLFKYYSWSNTATLEHNDGLVDLYNIYIKELIKLQKYIKKEMIQ